MIVLDKNKSQEIVENCSLGIVSSYYIDGCNYYVKKDEDLKEIIGYYLATFLGLKSIEYKSINIKDHNYSFSRDIRELYKFQEAKYLIGSQQHLSAMIQRLIDEDINNPVLYQNIVKMYVFDILFLNDDRHAKNWGLINKTDLILFDNFNIFSIYNPPYISYNPELFIGNNKIELYNNLYKDFEEFLNSCDECMLEIVFNMVDKSSLLNIKALFEHIEKEYNILLDERFLKIYEPHYTKILDIVNRKRGISNAR